MTAGDSAAAVIGKSVQIRGEVKGSEDLLVDGHVEGTITLTESRLTIGPHASVTANVAARDVILLGRLNGNIRASGRVELRKGCDLVGDIVSGRLSIEENAMFRGKVDLIQPGEKTAGTSAAPAKAAESPLFNAPAQK
jgi:cytoskeletal protein CcmA (bactofilin family)